MKMVHHITLKEAYEITFLSVYVCLYVYPPYKLLNSSANLYGTWYAYHDT
jgi:hypothetical protein